MRGCVLCAQCCERDTRQRDRRDPCAAGEEAMAGHLPFQASTTTATRYRTCCTRHTRRNQTRCRDTPASPFPFLALVRSAFCATGFALILRPATVVCAHHIKAEGGKGASVRHCACVCLRAMKHPDRGAHARLLRSVVPATAASWWARRRFFPIRKEERAAVEMRERRGKEGNKNKKQPRCPDGLAVCFSLVCMTART